LATRSEFVDVPFAGRSVRIECQWITPSASTKEASAPLIVFLHEGLGSVAMWKDYPQALCDAGGYRGLVYSRPGYGRSTPRARDERWDVDFMHRQAQELLPALFDRLGVAEAEATPWLLGHSDGASIALIHAASFPTRVAGVIAVAPHIVVEDVSLRSIAQARDAYRLTGIKGKLARYHDDVDSAFFGWNDIWLDPAFRAWNIEREMHGIRCRVLAIQGEDDEYGTMAQVDRLAYLVAQARLVKLAQCGHSPHRDQPERVVEAVVSFVETVTS
jgi:pimeloyl-ACP methyl ester carboxylesterase